MNLPSELDKAQFKYEMRQLYKNLGFDAALEVAGQMIVGAEVLLEVIVEERKKENQ